MSKSGYVFSNLTLSTSAAYLYIIRVIIICKYSPIPFRALISIIYIFCMTFHMFQELLTLEGSPVLTILWFRRSQQYLIIIITYFVHKYRINYRIYVYVYILYFLCHIISKLSKYREYNIPIIWRWMIRSRFREFGCRVPRSPRGRGQSGNIAQAHMCMRSDA